MQTVLAFADAEKAAKGKYFIQCTSGASFALGSNNAQMTLFTNIDQGRFWLRGPFYFKSLASSVLCRLPDDLDISEGGISGAVSIPDTGPKPGPDLGE